MIRFFQLITIFIIVIWGSPSFIYAFPIAPEIQAYHTLGSSGSSYTTVSGGLAIQLSKTQLGRNRWLHVLGIHSPETVAGLSGKIGFFDIDSSGLGIEIGLYDQWSDQSSLSGANIAIRHIEWEKTKSENTEGKVSTDIFHMGWTSGTQFMFLFGIDIGTIHSSLESFTELQIALGGRYNF